MLLNLDKQSDENHLVHVFSRRTGALKRNYTWIENEN